MMIIGSSYLFYKVFWLKFLFFVCVISKQVNAYRFCMRVIPKFVKIIMALSHLAGSTLRTRNKSNSSMIVYMGYFMSCNYLPNAFALGDVHCKYIPVRHKFSAGLMISPTDKLIWYVETYPAKCDRA